MGRGEINGTEVPGISVPFMGVGFEFPSFQNAQDRFPVFGFWCGDLLFVSVFKTDSRLLRTAAVIPFFGEAWVVVSSVMARLELARRLSPSLPSSGS